MVNKSTFTNWLKIKFEAISSEDETDHVRIECGIIRALSEYREKELSNLRMDEDFNKRLMNRLDHIEMEVVGTYSYKSYRNYRLPVFLSVGFAAIVTVGFSAFYSDDLTIPQFKKVPAHVTPINLKTNETYSRMNLEEDALIQELKNNPENVRLLEKLETYYSENGKKEQATEIHSMLESVSKKY